MLDLLLDVVTIDGGNLVTLTLQLAGFAAYALLLQEEGSELGGEDPDLARAFSLLDHVLNREASQRDPQGVVRR